MHGVRGETAHDMAQRARAAGTERMLREAEAAVVTYAASDRGVLVGGACRVATRFKKMLAMSDRVLHLESLHADASDADIAAAARIGASALRDATDLRRIVEIIGADANHDPAALGPAATRRALERRMVRELYVTRRYLEDHMADAEDAVRLALDQGAMVEQVSTAAAMQLDEHGGLAARLRYQGNDEAAAERELEPNVAAGVEST
jgi:stalled ribosome rescue protein Dom34